MSIPWLRDLEEKVLEAAARLRELESENAELKTEIQNLHSRLAAGELTAAPSSATTPGFFREPARAAWEQEKEDVRQRVARLVEHLEALLGD